MRVHVSFATSPKRFFPKKFQLRPHRVWLARLSRKSSIMWGVTKIPKCWLWISQYFFVVVFEIMINQIKYFTSITHKLLVKLFTEKVVKFHQKTNFDIFIRFIDMTLINFGDSSTLFGLTRSRILWSRHHHSKKTYTF